MVIGVFICSRDWLSLVPPSHKYARQLEAMGHHPQAVKKDTYFRHRQPNNKVGYSLMIVDYALGIVGI